MRRGSVALRRCRTKEKEEKKGKKDHPRGGEKERAVICITVLHTPSPRQRGGEGGGGKARTTAALPNLRHPLSVSSEGGEKGWDLDFPFLLHWSVLLCRV